MDRTNAEVNIKQEESVNSNFNRYVTEDGKQYTVPYRMIKMVTFSDLKKEELIDIPHAARLQYRLMLLDPVIKARVDFTKSRIKVIYNPRDSDNHKEKISLEELVDFLSKQGVHTLEECTSVEDYDYYRNLYSYAYNPPSIRERAPYGYTMEEWEGMKQDWERKMREGEIEKLAKYKAFQEEYLAENPEIAQKIVEGYKPKVHVEKKSILSGIFGGKSGRKDKGFWFHGV